MGPRLTGTVSMVAEDVQLERAKQKSRDNQAESAVHAAHKFKDNKRTGHATFVPTARKSSAANR